MGVPIEAPAEVHKYWAGVPNCAEIYLLFQLTSIGPTMKVKAEAWGQLANDNAAAHCAMMHIINKRKFWWAKYVGWEEIGGKNRSGKAPDDFASQLAAERLRWKD